MSLHFEFAPVSAATFPLSLMTEDHAAGLFDRLPEVRRREARASKVRLRELPVSLPPTRQIEARIASLRLRIANGTYRVTGMQVAESLIESTFLSQDV